MEEGGAATELLDFAAVAGDEAELVVAGTGGELVRGAEVVNAGDFFVPTIDAFAAVADGPVPDFDNVVCAAAGE